MCCKKSGFWHLWGKDQKGLFKLNLGKQDDRKESKSAGLIKGFPYSCGCTILSSNIYDNEKQRRGSRACTGRGARAR